MKNNNKKICKDWFIELQNLICKAVLELEKEYGKVDINVADGSIKYIKDEQADS